MWIGADYRLPCKVVSKKKVAELDRARQTLIWFGADKDMSIQTLWFVADKDKAGQTFRFVADKNRARQTL